MASAVDLVRRFRGLRALVIGDAMLDTYCEGTAARICSEGPVPVVRKTGEYRAPGGAANTAANLRALGADVIFLGVVGDDVSASLLRCALADRDVDDAGLIVDAQTATLHKLRILADGQYVVRLDEDGVAEYAVETHARLLAALERALPGCDLVVLSDYCYGAVTEPLVARLREQCAARGLPYLVDSKEVRRFPRLGATVITPNLLEARLLAEHGSRTSPSSLYPGKPVEGVGNAELRTSAASQPEEPARTVQEARRLARAALAAVDTRWVALTLAEYGALLMERDGDGEGTHLPAHPVAHANVAGAGDSFISAMGLALAAGAESLEAAQIGIEAASVAVTKRWTATVQHQELLQRVSLRDHTARPAARVPATEAAARQALSALLAELARERQAGRSIVFTNGVFDILHAGHVELLRAAKALGDVLVVGINTDRSARRLKGERRPINSEEDRLALVAALDVVDHALLFDEETPTNLIRALRPHIHVKGADYEHAGLPESAAVREVGGRVVLLPLVGDLSTTRMIERIARLTSGRVNDASEVEVGT